MVDDEATPQKGMGDDDAGKMLTAVEIADLLGVHQSTVYRWLADGSLPGYRFGDTWRVDEKEFRTWLAAAHNKPGVEDG